MAIDPKLVSIKTAAELPEGIPTAEGKFLYYEDDTLKTAEMSDLYDRLESSYLGILTPSSTIPATGSWYGTVLEAGTFNNVTPAITVNAADFDVENGTANNEVRIIISDGVATKVVRRLKGEVGYLFNFGVPNPVTGATSAGTGLTYIFNQIIPKNSVLRKLSFYSIAAGSFKLKRVSEEAGVYTFKEEVVVPVSIGLNEYELPNPIIFEDNDRLAVYTNIIGTIRYSNASGSYDEFKYYSGDLLTFTSSVNASTNQQLQMNFEFISIDIFNTIMKELKFLKDTIFQPFTFGQPSPANGNNIQPNFTYIFNQEIPKNSILKKVTFYSDNAGTVKLKIFNKAGSIYTFKKELSINVTTGINVHDITEEFTFGENDKLGFFTANTGTLNMISVPGDNYPFVWASGDVTTSASSVTASSNEQFQGFFEFLTFGTTTPAVVNEVNPTVLYANLKKSIPTDVENVGAAWTFGNTEATPAGLGLANAIQGVNFTNFNRTITRAQFTLKDSTAHFGLYNRPITFAQSGTIVTVDIATNKMFVKANWNGSNTMPAGNSEKLISFTLVQNRPYRLEIKKVDKDMIFTIFDLISGATDSLTISGGTVGIPVAGYAFGKAGVFAVAGSIGVSSLENKIVIKEEPIVIFSGDSITEGYGVLSTDNYAYKALALLDNKGLNSSQSSCTSLDVIERITEEKDFFKPKYWHVLIGTNESNMATWSANITTINNLLKNAGITPIFGCLPANIQNTAQVSTWNAELLSKGYRVVRYDLATTTNNDGVNIDTTKFLSDQRHPNALGGQAMFDRLKLDAPELFDIL